MRVRPTRRIIRSALVLIFLAVPPWMMLSIADLPLMWDFEPNSTVVQQSWQSLRRGGIPLPAPFTLTVVVLWLSWLRICWGFLFALGRMILHRPLRHDHRWPAKLAIWMLMISPTMAVAPSSVVASTISLETTEADFRSEAISSPQVLVSVLVAGGVLLRLRARRQRQLRTNTGAETPEVPTLETEVSRDHDEMAVVRLELAVRSLMNLQATSFRMIVQERNGRIMVEFPHDRLARPPWQHHAPRIWKLLSSVSLEELAQFSRGQSGVIPLLLPVGITEAGDMWVNLQEVRVFGVDGDGDDAEVVWRGICQSLALSPFSEHVSFISTEGQSLLGRREVLVTDAERACAIARHLHTDESPAVIFAHQRFGDDSPGVVLHRQRPAEDEFGISKHAGGWLVHPTMTGIDPIRCNNHDFQVLDSLVPPVAEVALPSIHDAPTRVEAFSDVISRHQFVASVLGVPHIRHVSGIPVIFERSRSEELVIWLALHPAAQRRSMARAEMWSIAIKDSTFSNVTSDVRRSLTLVEPPPDDAEWLGVTLTDELPLHPLIVSDADLLAQCFDHARRFPEDRSVEILEYGLSLVSGVPFGGSTYLWRDTTGLGSEFSMLVVRAALLLADMHAERGDVPGASWKEGVYWATAQGLLAIPGHEDLVIRRMELHARSGDHASLCAEWQAYCRALASDDWGDVDPSPKMVGVWRQLSQGK